MLESLRLPSVTDAQGVQELTHTSKIADTLLANTSSTLVNLELLSVPLSGGGPSSAEPEAGTYFIQCEFLPEILRAQKLERLMNMKFCREILAATHARVSLLAHRTTLRELHLIKYLCLESETVFLEAKSEELGRALKLSGVEVWNFVF